MRVDLEGLGALSRMVSFLGDLASPSDADRDGGVLD